MAHNSKHLQNRHWHHNNRSLKVKDVCFQNQDSGGLEVWPYGEEGDTRPETPLGNEVAQVESDCHCTQSEEDGMVCI